LTRWLWDGIGAGAKGVIFWCWHPRRFGREGGEWGLVNADASATPRSEAVTRITRALTGPTAFLHGAEPLPARAAILYNRPALVLAALDERSPPGGDRVILSLLGCHRALCERQIPVDFLSEDDLRRGVASRYAVLYLPYSYALEDAAAAAVRRYVAEGGTVWADGPLAWKDERGGVRPELPGGLWDVFGLQVDEIQPAPAPFRLTPGDAQAGDTLRLAITLRGAELLAQDAEGQPAATRHGFGKGTAIYFGTCLALGYHQHPDPQAGAWLAAPARSSAQQLPVSATTDAPRVFFRGLSCPEGLAAILSNPGAECSVRVAFRGEITAVEEVLRASRLATVVRDGACCCEVKVPAGGVSILLARIPVTGSPRKQGGARNSGLERSP
jgi:beta-galactosidase